MPTSFDALLKNWLTKISNSIKGISVSGDTLTVTKTDNSTEDLTLGLQALERKIFAQSTWYKRPQLMSVNKKTITVPKGTQVAINGNLYVSTVDNTINLFQNPAVSGRAGKDVYVYACVPESGTEPVFVVSKNSTVPDGYTAQTSRKIGGVHCLCADVGTIADHPLSGYEAGDILPASVWDLLFRAVSENEGMIAYNGKWYDIYPSALSSDRPVSVFNGFISRSYDGETFSELAARVKKHLLTREEFVNVAKGSNEKTLIDTTDRPSYDAGAHVDTNGRRCISNIGLEDCCGGFYQWTSDIWGAFNDTSNSYSRQGGIGVGTQSEASGDTPAEVGTHTLVGYSTQTDGRGTTNVSVSNTINLFGLAYGALVRAKVGKVYLPNNDGSACGSRAVTLSSLSSGKDSITCLRGASWSRVVNL